MSMLLSVLVCIAMLFGTGEMPATPETATSYTLSNVILSVDGQSVALNPSAQLTLALGSEQAELGLSVDMDGDTLLPVGARLTPDALDFKLDNSGKVYRFSAETLAEAMGLNGEDAESANVAIAALTTYCELLRDLSNPELAEKFSNAVLKSWIDRAAVEPEDVQVELNGANVDAKRYKLSLSVADMVGALDALADCGDADVELLYEKLAQMLSSVTFSDEANFATIAEEIDADAKLDIDWTAAEADGAQYGRAIVSVQADGAQAMKFDIEASAADGVTDFTYQIDAEMAGQKVDMSIEASYTGDPRMPDDMTMSYDLNVLSGSATAIDDAPADAEPTEAPFRFENGIAQSGDLDWSCEDGLRHISYIINSDQTSRYGYDGDMDEITGTVGLQMNYDETRADDGSVTGSFALDAAVDSGDAATAALSLGFDINRAQTPYVDGFAGATVVELTDNQEDACYSELSASLMGAYADLMRLSTDESVQQLTEMFNAPMDATDDAEYEADPYISDDEIGDYVNYGADLDAALAAFNGTMPGFSAPEGYALTDAYCNGDDLNLVYAGDENSFEIHLSTYGENDAQYAVITAEGGYQSIEGAVVEITPDGAGGYDWAEVYGLGVSMDIFFYDVDAATADAIIAGLSI